MPAVCPPPAPYANYRIDPITQIDNTDRNTPDQQAPRSPYIQAEAEDS